MALPRVNRLSVSFPWSTDGHGLFAFFQNILAVRRKVDEGLRYGSRPANLDFAHQHFRTQPEMQAEIVVGKIAAAAAYFSGLAAA